MSAVLIALLQVAACMGFGLAGLRVLGVAETSPERERLVYAFALGMGVTGWLVFFIGTSGYLNNTALAVLLGVGAVLAILQFPRKGLSVEMPGGVNFMLIVALLAASGFMDLLEAFTPSGDADSLAYHFALPKQFIAAGRIEFVPRALDGATALLVQMTYVPALALGGDVAMLLWTFASGWAAVFSVFVLSRRHLNQTWSAALALAFATTPAVVYGAGAGQVEVRNLIFVIAALLAVTAKPEANSRSYVLIAGLLAGFFVGGKYMGLMFAATCGLAVLWETRRIVDGAIFGAAVLIAGFQWYLWNAIHVGDPFFPVFFEWIGNADSSLWTAANQEWFREKFVPSYKSVPSNLFWLIAFPFKATLGGEKAFESGRTGFGPLVWVLLPFAMAGIWKFRRSIKPGPLLTYALVVLVFYVLWFFSQSPQRVRFLLPVYPLLLVLVGVAATRFAEQPLFNKPLAVGVALGIALQFAGQSLFTLKSAQYVMGAQARQAFLEQTISDFGAAPWINANLGREDKLFLQDRNYLFYLDVPYFYAHPSMQAQVNLLPGSSNVETFVRELKDLGISHVLITLPNGGLVSETVKLSTDAEKAGCLVLEKSFSVATISSRTLPSLKNASREKNLYRLVPEGCA